MQLIKIIKADYGGGVINIPSNHASMSIQTYTNPILIRKGEFDHRIIEQSQLKSWRAAGWQVPATYGIANKSTGMLRNCKVA